MCEVTLQADSESEGEVMTGAGSGPASEVERLECQGTCRVILRS